MHASAYVICSPHSGFAGLCHRDSRFVIHITCEHHICSPRVFVSYAQSHMLFEGSPRMLTPCLLCVFMAVSQLRVNSSHMAISYAPIGISSHMLPFVFPSQMLIFSLIFLLSTYAPHTLKRSLSILMPRHCSCQSARYLATAVCKIPNALFDGRFAKILQAREFLLRSLCYCPVFRF